MTLTSTFFLKVRKTKRTNGNSHAEKDWRRVADEGSDMGDGRDASEDSMAKCGARKESRKDEAASESCQREREV